MTPLRITHASGQRALTSYRVPDVLQRYSVLPDLHRGSGGIVMRGDHGVIPDAFTVEAWVEAGGLPAAYSLALAIVTECETATLVSSHWGGVPVDGLLGFRATSDGQAVRLVLDFAPTQGDLLPRVTADSTIVTADTTTVTADAVHVT